MGTVTGLTAARMIAIEAASIVDGTVVGNNLILTRHDGGTIDAGNVRGPTGSPGVTLAELDDRMPIGFVGDYIGTTPPNSLWLPMIGQTITGGSTTYSTLWGRLPATMKSGSDIIFPDTRGKFSVGYNSSDTSFDVIGETGGSKTATIGQANLPNVTITIDPPSTNFTVNPPSNSTDASWQLVNDDVPATSKTGIKTDTVGYDGGRLSQSIDILPFTATVDIGSFNSGPLGSGTPLPIVPPYVVFLKMIKVL